MSSTTAYTDGACSRNPGPGGWAWAVPDGPSFRGSAVATTNQRMELTAVISACESLEGELVIVSDSAYVVNCWRDKWYVRWMAEGWTTSSMAPVANRDLWEMLVPHFQSGRVTLQWVKGHSGDPMNDLVDRLAVRACLEQEPEVPPVGSAAEVGTLGLLFETDSACGPS